MELAVTTTEAALSAIEESLAQLSVTLGRMASRQEHMLVVAKKMTAALSPVATTTPVFLPGQLTTKPSASSLFSAVQVLGAGAPHADAVLTSATPTNCSTKSPRHYNDSGHAELAFSATSTTWASSRASLPTTTTMSLVMPKRALLQPATTLSSTPIVLDDSAGNNTLQCVLRSGVCTSASCSTHVLSCPPDDSVAHALDIDTDLYAEVLTHVGGVSLFEELELDSADEVFNDSPPDNLLWYEELAEDVFTHMGSSSLFLEQNMDTHHELEGEKVDRPVKWVSQVRIACHPMHWVIWSKFRSSVITPSPPPVPPHPPDKLIHYLDPCLPPGTPAPPLPPDPHSGIGSVTTYMMLPCHTTHATLLSPEQQKRGDGYVVEKYDARAIQFAFLLCHGNSVFTNVGDLSLFLEQPMNSVEESEGASDTGPWSDTSTGLGHAANEGQMVYLIIPLEEGNGSGSLKLPWDPGTQVDIIHDPIFSIRYAKNRVKLSLPWDPGEHDIIFIGCNGSIQLVISRTPTKQKMTIVVDSLGYRYALARTQHRTCGGCQFSGKEQWLLHHVEPAVLSVCSSILGIIGHTIKQMIAIPFVHMQSLLASRLSQHLCSEGSTFTCLVLHSLIFVGHTMVYSMNGLLMAEMDWEDCILVFLAIECYVQWDPGIMHWPFLDNLKLDATYKVVRIGRFEQLDALQSARSRYSTPVSCSFLIRNISAYAVLGLIRNTDLNIWWSPRPYLKLPTEALAMLRCPYTEERNFLDIWWSPARHMVQWPFHAVVLCRITVCSSIPGWVLNIKYLARTIKVSFINLLLDGNVWEDRKSIIFTTELCFQWDPGIMMNALMVAISGIGKLSSFIRSAQQSVYVHLLSLQALGELLKCIIESENCVWLQYSFQFLASSGCTCSFSCWSNFCARHQGYTVMAVLIRETFKRITSECAEYSIRSGTLPQILGTLECYLWRSPFIDAYVLFARRQLPRFESKCKCQDFYSLVITANKGQYMPWDPGGVHARGVHAIAWGQAMFFGGGIVTPRTLDEVGLDVMGHRPGNHGLDYWEMPTKEKLHTGKGIDELNRPRVAPVPLSRPLPLRWPLSTSGDILRWPLSTSGVILFLTLR